MKENNISIKRHSFYILIIFFSSFIISFSYPFLQYGVDGGLVLSNRVIYPDDASPMKFYFFNSWTSIHQLAFLLLKIGFTVTIISKILMFFCTFLMSIGIFLFSNSITKQINISILITLVAMILGKNFGDTDYPSLVYSEHTYGMMALALVTCIFGLFANKNLILATTFSMILVSLHPMIGIWILFVIFIGIFFSKSYKFYKIELLRGALIGSCLLISSFLFFYFNTIHQLQYNPDLFQNYLKNWDGHRSINEIVHYEYIAKTILLLSLIIFFVDKKDYNVHLIIIAVSGILSLIIYLIFKIFPNIFPLSILIAMPSRFIMLHTLIGWPIIISIIYSFLIRRYNFKNISIFFTIFLVALLIQNFSKITSIKSNLINEFKKKENFEVINFIKESNSKGHIITSSNFTSEVFKKTEKPILLHTESLDFIPYHPYLVNKFFDILREIYEIDDLVPPNRNNPSLSDEYIKKIFENKSNEDWSQINKKYNIDFIIVPKNWNLNLEIIREDEKFRLYK